MEEFLSLVLGEGSQVIDQWPEFHQFKLARIYIALLSSGCIVTRSYDVYNFSLSTA